MANKPCRHCGLRGDYRPGGLCRVCYVDPDIRRHYPRDRCTEAVPPLQLPKMDCYPDSYERPRCQHGLLDGECPTCERAQRALVFTRQEEQLDDW